MRLSIDAMPLLVRSAGVKNYLYHWIAHLARAAPPGVSIELFPWLGTPGPLDHQASQVGALHTWLSLGLFHFFNLPGNPTLDWVHRADVFHCTRLRNPPRRPRLTATLYDLTCWSMPQLHTAANVAAERRLAETVWKRAAGLIAISAYTRDEAVRRLGLDPGRIRVIYPGVDARFFAAAEAGPAGHAAIRARYRLERPYLLSVGTLEPRKNLDRALDAYATLPASLRAEFAFVVAGPVGWAAEQTVRRLRAHPEGVRYLGYVPEADLPGLTAGAAALFYPSLEEGFGLPVAQAMACGVPVVTSSVSALPEVAGEGALYADPHSPAELRAALERLLLSPELGRQLAEAGRRRAARYRWEESARQSMEFFKAVSNL